MVKMPLPEAINPIVAGPKICNESKKQDKDIKIVIINMFEDFKEDMDKSFNEVCENTKS